MHEHGDIAGDQCKQRLDGHMQESCLSESEPSS